MRNIRHLVVMVVALALLALFAGAVSGCQQGDSDTAAQESEDQVSPDEQLIKAIGAGDTAALAAALKEGADANAESTPGRPALFLAASRGNAQAARLLIDAGADVRADTVDGAILVTAAREGHREIVEMLLDAGVDIESIGRAWEGGDGTALWAAAVNGHAEVGEMLVERGADVNTEDTDGISALMLAAANDMPQLVELLLENGAEIDHQADSGRTALHGAALHIYRGISSPESARVLIAHGAALDIQDAEGRTPLDIAQPDVAEILRAAGAAE